MQLNGTPNLLLTNAGVLFQIECHTTENAESERDNTYVCRLCEERENYVLTADKSSSLFYRTQIRRGIFSAYLSGKEVNMKE
jgi:hypothetical protein